MQKVLAQYLDIVITPFLLVIILLLLKWTLKNSYGLNIFNTLVKAKRYSHSEEKPEHKYF